jgi:hypothetical protein
MQDSFFRQLNEQEEKEFIKWANDNFKPDMEVNPTWHPIIRKEIAKLQSEYDSQVSEDALYDFDLGQFDDDPNPYDGTYSED